MPTRRQLKRAAKEVAQRASSTQAALASADSDDEPATTPVVIELTTAAPLNNDGNNSMIQSDELATEATEPLDAPLNSGDNNDDDNAAAPATEATEPLDAPLDDSGDNGDSTDAPATECVNDAQAFVTITNGSVDDKMVEVPANDDGAALERSSGSNAEPQETKSRGPFKSALRKVAIAVVVPVAVGGLVICASSMVCAQGGWALTKVGARAHLGALRLAFRGAGAVVGITTGVASCVFSSRTK